MPGAIGPQIEARKKTEPKFGFGSADRNAVAKVYVSKEHSKTDFGKITPGAIYETKSTFGKQDLSKNRSSSSCSFGSASRFLKPSGERAKRNPQVPGPGSYPAQTSIGKMVSSERQTGEAFSFGGATRDAAQKVFLSKAAAKVTANSDGPGPTAYEPQQSMGPQRSSSNVTEPTVSFPTAGRGRDPDLERAKKQPGAGQYRVPNAVGVQAESQKRSMPRYGFGSTTREHRDKVYISSEHSKSEFGMTSPGPAAIGPKAFGGTGKQVLSTKRTGATGTFGNAARATYATNSNPGPGEYAV